MNHLNSFGAALLAGASLCAGAADAMSLGTPFLVAESDLSGGLLDYFDFGMPSGLKILSASGTITEAFGAPALIGSTIDLELGAIPAAPGAVMSLSIAGVEFLSAIGGGSGSLLDGLGITDEGVTGVFSFTLLAGPAYTEIAYDPATFEGTFAYDDPFADFGPRTGSAPEFEIGVNVHVDLPLPTKTFEITDGSGAVVDAFDYVEGALTVTRIELGVVGGPAIVPLPATLPLLAAGLGLLGLARRRV